ncbi:Kelch repeat-containing protein [Leptospira santarosai]|uniref:Kelch repeat-containing protein n=1 Tax=Leptospira santarosai TaxID=28183 RepID=UPI0024AE9603|nr:kelch repeat-containing protein [Leptospira santarosai]MDI7219435.1 kelch-like protein [Leptospira santarosai]MDO6384587.1 kelch-like protein [Leptospira santarosai]
MKNQLIKILIIISLIECKTHYDNNNEELGLITLYILNTQKYGRYGQSSVSLDNDTILIIGGQDGYRIQNDLSIYDPNRNLVYQVGQMRTRRSNFKSVRLLDGRVLIVGGVTLPVNEGENQGVTDQTEIYDPITNSIILGPKLNQARADFTLDLLNDGRVLVVGGRGSDTVLRSVEIFDPNTMTMNQLGNMNFNRFLHTSTMLNNGKILIIGGLDNSRLTIGTTELFDPNTMNFTQSGNLSVSRMLHTANLLPNNNVIVIGGHKVTDPPYAINTKVMEVFDSGSNLFSSVGNITGFRSGHTSNLISNDELLLCGGEQIVKGLPILSSCEVYNLATYSVVEKGEMLSKRSFHSAHNISNSRMFISSGFKGVDLESGIPNASKTSEIYDYTSHRSTSVNGDL